MKIQSRANIKGFSIVEIMISVTIFVVVALIIAGVHQRARIDSTNAKFKENIAEYLKQEVQRLNVLSRVPERNNNLELVYRDANGNIVNSGGSLVPYGYNNKLSSSNTELTPTDQVVTYPDILGPQYDSITSSSTRREDQTIKTDKITLKRRYAVEIVNANQADEYKKITVTLSDAKPSSFINEQSQVVIIKKPDPRALDTRLANGTASLGGSVKDKANGAVPAQTVTVTLVPSDATPTRTLTCDANGNFYFSPPLNPRISYTINFQCTGFYFPRTITMPINVGTNLIAGDSRGMVLMSPILYAETNIQIKDGDSSTSLSGAVVNINHDGTPPNGGDPSYTKTTDSNGIAYFKIKIPAPDVTTYSKYYVKDVALAGYISIVNDLTTPNIYLALNQGVLLNRSYTLYKEKKGKAKITVLNSDGMPCPNAYVEASIASNYSTIGYKGSTDSSGQFIFTDLLINTPAYPTQTSRLYYFRITSANHLPYTNPSGVLVKANEEVSVNIQLLPHKLDTYYVNNYSFGVKKGLSANWALGLAYYRDFEGTTRNYDITRGPVPSNFNPNPTDFNFLLKIFSGVYPAKFTYSGWDSSIITVTELKDNPTYGSKYSDYVNVVGLRPDRTKIDVTAQFSFSWNGVPYTLTTTRSYPITVTDNTNLLTVSMSPSNITRINPNSIQKFSTSVSPLPAPVDLTYTWSVTGVGVADFTPINAAGLSVSNGSPYAVACNVKASNILKSQFNISVTVNSPFLAQTASTNKQIDVDYTDLVVTINPTSLNAQPGNVKTFTPTISGGSGLYSYLWSLTNPGNGDPETYIGSINQTDGATTTFTALQIGGVNLNLEVTDRSSNRSKVAIPALINVQPSGGTIE